MALHCTAQKLSQVCGCSLTDHDNKQEYNIEGRHCMAAEIKVTRRMHFFFKKKELRIARTAVVKRSVAVARMVAMDLLTYLFHFNFEIVNNMPSA